MKKLLLIAAALTATTASAASLMQTVTVTATVVSACQVDGVTAGSFTYDAINGIAANSATNATAKFKCNLGTVPTLDTTLTPQTGALNFGANGLVASYNILSNGGLVNAAGGTDTTFSVIASAAANQWAVANNTYSATLDINVTF